MRDLPEMIPMKKLEAILDYLGEDPIIYEGIVNYLNDEADARDSIYDQLSKDGFDTGEKKGSIQDRETRIKRVNDAMIDLGFIDHKIWRKPYSKE